MRERESKLRSFPDSGSICWLRKPSTKRGVNRTWGGISIGTCDILRARHILPATYISRRINKIVNACLTVRAPIGTRAMRIRTFLSIQRFDQLFHFFFFFLIVVVVNIFRSLMSFIRFGMWKSNLFIKFKYCYENSYQCTFNQENIGMYMQKYIDFFFIRKRRNPYDFVTIILARYSHSSFREIVPSRN